MSNNYGAPLQPTSKKPGAAGFVIGALLIVVGFTVGMVMFFTSFLGQASDVSNAQAFDSDGTFNAVTLSGGQQTGIWVNNSGVGTCEVDDPSGLPISVSTSVTSSQTVNGFDLVATFTPDGNGDYLVACLSTGTDFSYKVAPVMFSSGAMGWVLGIAIMAVGIIAGIVLLIVTGVRRSHWTKNNRPTPAPQGQSWGSYPPTGQTAPTYQPEQYPTPPQRPYPGYPGYQGQPPYSPQPGQQPSPGQPF
ncbi:MAG: hypothetical protein FWD80_07605 [Propionibacteriaceae bacterium]|nr:hypothetical protein [Propionibacteriaceae bacterium]